MTSAVFAHSFAAWVGECWHRGLSLFGKPESPVLSEHFDSFEQVSSVPSNTLDRESSAFASVRELEEIIAGGDGTPRPFERLPFERALPELLDRLNLDDEHEAMPDLLRLCLLAEEVRSAFGTEEPFLVPRGYEEAARVLLRRYCDWLRECLGDGEYAVRFAGVPASVYEKAVFPPLETSRWWTRPLRQNTGVLWNAQVVTGAPFVPGRCGMPTSLLVHDLLREDANMEILDEIDRVSTRWWTVEEKPSAEPVRQYSMDSVDDYVQLVERYPMLVPTHAKSGRRAGHVPYELRSPIFEVPVDVIVDWQAASIDFDAVSINAETYFTGAWFPIETERGITTLADWSPECVYYLKLDNVALKPRGELAETDHFGSFAPA